MILENGNNLDKLKKIEWINIIWTIWLREYLVDSSINWKWNRISNNNNKIKRNK